MGQLARRLREVLPHYGVDPRLHQAELDAIDARERTDPQGAHDVFEALRLKVARGRHRDLHDRLVAHGFVTGLLPADTTTLKLKDVDREINDLQAALRHADQIAEALATARAHAATLRERRFPVDAAPFASVPLEELVAAAERAEALRRGAAQEARVEERVADARRRSARLTRVPVAVPDLGADAEPDPQQAAAQLEVVEARLAEAEAVEEAHGRVLRHLRDSAVREFRRETARDLERRADQAVSRPHVEARAALQTLETDADRLRVEAAGLARQAARARKRGAAGPDRERRGGDLPDYYG